MNLMYILVYNIGQEEQEAKKKKKTKKNPEVGEANSWEFPFSIAKGNHRVTESNTKWLLPGFSYSLYWLKVKV
jgi:hypothetical protein